MLNLCESSILETWRGRIFMLAQTVRSNLKDINNLRMRTKTTKFSSLFQTAPTVGVEEDEVRQVLMKDGLIEISDDEQWEEIVVEDEESCEEDFDIVEDNVLDACLYERLCNVETDTVRCAGNPGILAFQ